MTLPSRITEEARELARHAATVREDGGWLDEAADPIARALLAAEQRGREMEREEVASNARCILDYLNQNASVGDEVSAEIGRALLALSGEHHKVTGEPFTHPLVRSRTTEG